MPPKKKNESKEVSVVVEKRKGSPRPNAGRPVLSGALIEATPELIHKICTILRIGSYIEVAAAVNGIGYSTLRMWVTKAKEHPDSLYGEFARAVEKAVSDAETRDLAVIDMHANGRDAVFEMEPVVKWLLDKEGQPIKDAKGDYLNQPVMGADGRPLMRVARNKNHDAIVKRSEVKPQWTAAAWKLERRNPARWGRAEYLDKIHEGLTAEDPQIAEDRNKVTEEKVKVILEKFESEY